MQIAKTPVQRVEPVRGDGTGAILNGWPVTPYLPADPERRASLLAVLGIRETGLLTRED